MRRIEIGGATAVRSPTAGDTDPLINTVTLNCTVQGVPAEGFDRGNVLDTSDDHTVELFQPGYSLACVAKGGCIDVIDGDVFLGDFITYEFTLDDLSSPDTLSMALVSYDFTIDGVPATIALLDPLVDATVPADHTVDGAGRRRWWLASPQRTSPTASPTSLSGRHRAR